MTSLDPLTPQRPKADAGRSLSGGESGARAAPGFGAMLDSFDTRPAPQEAASSGDEAGSEAQPLPVDPREETDAEGSGITLRDLIGLTAPVPAAPQPPPDAALAAVVQRAVARAGTTTAAETPTLAPRITLVGIETHFAPVRPAAAEVGAGATGLADTQQAEMFGPGGASGGSSATPAGFGQRLESAKSAAAVDTASVASPAMAERGLMIGGAAPERSGGALPATGLPATSAGADSGTASAATAQSAPSSSNQVPPGPTLPAAVQAAISPEVAQKSSAQTSAAPLGITGGRPDPARPVRSTGPGTPAGEDADAPDERLALDRPTGGAKVAGGPGAPLGAPPSSADASGRPAGTGTPPAGPLGGDAAAAATPETPSRASAGNGVATGRSDAARDAGSPTPDLVDTAKRSDTAPARIGETGRREPSPASERSLGAGLGTESVPAPTGSATVAAPTGIPAPASPVRQIFDAVSAQFPPPAPASPARTGLSVEAGPLRILTLQLHPADLGTVLVRMRLQDGRLEMNLRTGREETAERLRREGGALSALLQEAGYAPEALTIEAGSSASGNATERGTGQNLPFGGQERHQGGATPDQSADRRPSRQGNEATPQSKEQDHDPASRPRDRGDVYL